VQLIHQHDKTTHLTEGQVEKFIRSCKKHRRSKVVMPSLRCAGLARFEVAVLKFRFRDFQENYFAEAIGGILFSNIPNITVRYAPALK